MQDAIDELASISKVYVTGNGVKTTSALLDELYALIDAGEINYKSRLVFAGEAATALSIGTEYRFNQMAMNTPTIYINEFSVKASGSTSKQLAFNTNNSNSSSDNSSYVLPSGKTIELIY